MREAVLALWHEQGLAPGNTHLDVFGLTPHERVGPDLTFLPEYAGRVFELSSREYRKAFEVTSRRFPADWRDTVRRLRDRDHVACIWASRGFFQALGVGDWPTLERALVATVRDPDRVRSRLRWYGDFCAAMLELALEDVEPEFVLLSEPISDNDGPLISPAMFEDFMIPVYHKIIATARSHGCDNILVSTYGNSATLFAAMIAAGISMLWMSEAPDIPDLDYRTLRRRFGPAIGLIGGIPLAILRREAPDEMRHRVSEIAAPLLDSGRYIPLAAGRVREGISWGAYKRYRETLAELMG